MTTDAATTRRWVIRTGGTAAAGAAVLAATPGAAQAAARVRTVTQQVPLRWSYDAATKKTTVRRYRERTVTARFAGHKVLLRKRGAWVRVPYVWDKHRKALVFSRALQLALAAAPAKPTKPTPTTPPPPTTPTTPTTGRLAASVTTASPYVGTSMAWHLARRLTFGPTATLVAEIAKGPDAWLAAQLAPSTVSDTAFEAYVSRYPHLDEPIWKTKAAIDGEDDFSDWDAKMGVAGSTVARALWSERQLQAVMEDFWSNHFNVHVLHDAVGASRAHYAATLRAGAFGRFADLLVAVTTHPSMLYYLDNAESDAEHPNENLGRELLELHTVGVSTPYGEDGVLASARILTGLSVDDDSGEFAYKPWMHWTGSVTVLGFHHANATQEGGLDVAKSYLDYLAHHSATATRIATKLVTRFVSDSPPPALVAALAKVYLANDTRIAPVLDALFHSAEFAASAGAKVARPFERIAATVRILGYGPESEGVDIPISLWNLAGDAGQAPLMWEPPNGYPDVSGAWLSTAATLASWNNRLMVAAQWWPVGYSNDSLATNVLPATTSGLSYGQLVQKVAVRLFGRAPTDAHLAAVLAWLEVSATDTVGADDDALGWQLASWVALLLDSPYGTRR